MSATVLRIHLAAVSMTSGATWARLFIIPRLDAVRLPMLRASVVAVTAPTLVVLRLGRAVRHGRV